MKEIKLNIDNRVYEYLESMAKNAKKKIRNRQIWAGVELVTICPDPYY